MNDEPQYAMLNRVKKLRKIPWRGALELGGAVLLALAAYTIHLGLALFVAGLYLVIVANLGGENERRK